VVGEEESIAARSLDEGRVGFRPLVREDCMLIAERDIHWVRAYGVVGIFLFFLLYLWFHFLWAGRAGWTLSKAFSIPFCVVFFSSFGYFFCSAFWLVGCVLLERGGRSEPQAFLFFGYHHHTSSSRSLDIYLAFTAVAFFFFI
jgi:hypothetical protein